MTWVELARRRIQRRESGEWEREQREAEVMCKEIEWFREHCDKGVSGPSRLAKQRREHHLSELLDAQCPELTGEWKDNVFKTLTSVGHNWKVVEVALDLMGEGNVPHEDPFASGEPEPLTYSIVKQDIIDDRRENFLYWEMFVPLELDLPDDEVAGVEFPAYCYWLAAKTLIYGLEHVPSMKTILTRYYPKTNSDLLNEIRRFAHKHKLADAPDMNAFLGKFFGEYPELFNLCGGMLQTYSDAVRTERTVLNKADRERGVGLLPDGAGCVVDWRKHDLWNLRQRIRNAYDSTGNFKRVAKMFERREGDVKGLLIDIGAIAA